MLSVHELNRLMESKRKEKYSTFDKIYQQCLKHILKYANNDKYRCFFTVPEFILGLPVYNLNAAIMYIMDKLKANAFLVKYYHPNVVYISWNLDEIHGRFAYKASDTKAPLPVPPRLILPNQKQFFPPMPEQTRIKYKPDQGSSSIIMPKIPSYDLPMPQASYGSHKPNNNFIKSISKWQKTVMVTTPNTTTLYVTSPN